jgi:hypothetical protein
VPTFVVRLMTVAMVGIGGMGVTMLDGLMGMWVGMVSV